MEKWQILSAREQVTIYIRQSLISGRWQELMPGCDSLAAELGVGKDTVDTALTQLENEGLLIAQGKRKRRKIAFTPMKQETSARRFGLLLSERSDAQKSYIGDLRMMLEQHGHQIIIAPKTMIELGMDLKKIGAMVEKMEIDGWIVLAGARDVLEWFAKRAKPAFAIFGRRKGLDLAGAGPEKISTLKEAVKVMANLGHKRIVLLTRKRRRSPSLGDFEQAFLLALEENGIKPTEYHIPDWEECIDGFHQRLKALFGITPPTALVLDEAPLFVAAQHFLSQKGIKIPDDVSLFCNDYDTCFSWCEPQISHIRWDSEPIIRHTLQWANNVGRGVVDKKQVLTDSEFVRGGTIAQVKH
jgi:DNA-binding LacI/PurR family transcriptional regulator